MIPGFAFVDRNQELGFDVRSTIGGGVGRTFIQSGRTIFGGGGGFRTTRSCRSRARAPATSKRCCSLSYEVFTYNFPKLENRILRYHGVSRPERRGPHPAQFEGAIQSRVSSTDFYTSFTIYDDYDRPPPGGADKSNDFGVTFSLGVKF